MDNEKEFTGLWRTQLESAICSLVRVAETLPPRMNRKVISPEGAAALCALRPIIPYCLQPAGNDGSMILVNRDYLPLGLAVLRYAIPEYIDRALYKWAHIPPDNPISELGSTYFFGDGSAPWRSKGALDDLIERLRRLLAMADDLNIPVNLSSLISTDNEVQQ
ncbi:MAG: hypothetical protein ACD_75C02623G0002 [uncultured bacterium]|nr:MAG: hypothetical protein ACD_75C02623G0002 [uncultured bacterium]